MRIKSFYFRKDKYEFFEIVRFKLVKIIPDINDLRDILFCIHLLSKRKTEWFRFSVCWNFGEYFSMGKGSNEFRRKIVLSGKLTTRLFIRLGHFPLDHKQNVFHLCSVSIGINSWIFSLDFYFQFRGKKTDCRINQLISKNVEMGGRTVSIEITSGLFSITLFSYSYPPIQFWKTLWK